jgi:inner membrane protein
VEVLAMSGHTHVTVAAAVGVWLAPAVVSPRSATSALAVWLLGVTVGGLLPDVDEPASVLGRRCWWLAWPLARLVGHRTLTHSLLGVVLIGWALATLGPALLPPVLAPLAPLLGLAVSSGMLVHLLLDACSGSICLWWPLPPRVTLASWPVFGWQDRLLGGLAALLTLWGGLRLLGL